MRRINSTEITRSGFTILELLIVIVVIAILATVSIVAYNGIQNRAWTSAAAATVNVYEKALRLVKAENGVYPALAGGSNCLGHSEDYPAEGSLVAGACDVSCWGACDPPEVVNESLTAMVAARVDSAPHLKWPVVTQDFGAGSFRYSRGLRYQVAGNGAVTIGFYVPTTYSCPAAMETDIEADYRWCWKSLE